MPFMLKPTSSKRRDSITLNFHEVNVRLSVKKRKDWGALGRLLKEAMFRESDGLRVLHSLYAEKPELVIGYTLWALTNGHRPPDKRLGASIDRQLKIGHTEEERSRYTFHLTATFLYGFLGHLKSAWKGPVPVYLERFREDLHGGGFKAVAPPWGARAVRECMKRVDRERVRRVSSASFARKYCYPRREILAVWLRVLLQGIEQAERGEGKRGCAFLLDEGQKGMEAWEKLKQGSAVEVFMALFCLAWKYPAEAKRLERTDPDVADMNARVRAFLRARVREKDIEV